MLKNTLTQSMQQKLSPSQIQLMNMLALPVLAFEQYIKTELDSNPALEVDYDHHDVSDEATDDELSPDAQDDGADYTDIRIDSDDDISAYMYDDDMDDVYSRGDTTYNKNAWIASRSADSTFTDALLQQLSLEPLSERQSIIGRYIIGNIDADGYMRRDLMSISDDIAFAVGLEVSEDEVREVLKIVQGFEPVGVGATSLQECLSIQLRAKTQTPYTQLAEKIVAQHFDALSKKNYEKILRAEGCPKKALSMALDEISSLNPRPGGGTEDGIMAGNMQITPDFIITIENRDVEGAENIIVSINNADVPSLRVGEDFVKMLTSDSSASTRSQSEATAFARNKVDAARWFIDAIRQRSRTMMSIMTAIVRRQRAFVLSGDVAELRPMGLKDIAEDVKMDISTVSRVVSQKYADTPYGTISLKDFFSDGGTTVTGEDVSVRQIKQALSNIIAQEDKKSPLTDESLTEMLVAQGYKLARRTVAKYREALGFPTARMRREV